MATAAAAAAEVESEFQPKDVAGVAEAAAKVAAAKVSAAKVATESAEAVLVKVVGVLPLLFQLRAVPDVVCRNPTPENERSIEGQLQERLEAAQRSLVVRVCGTLSGGITSGVAATATMAATAAASTAAAAAPAGEDDLQGNGRCGDTVLGVAIAGESGAKAGAAGSATVSRAAGVVGGGMAGGAASAVHSDGVQVAGNGSGGAACGEADDGEGFEARTPTPQLPNAPEGVFSSDAAWEGDFQQMDVDDGLEDGLADGDDVLEDGSADGGGTGGGGSTGNIGEDMGRPRKNCPYAGAPVDGDRCYQLDALDVPDSDDDTDTDVDGFDTSDVGDAPADGIAEAPHGNGTLLMQSAVGDPKLSAVMPSAEVVDVVLGTAAPAAGSSDCLTMRAMLEQELTMMELFLVRLRGDAFVTWARKSGVLLRDVATAAERLRHAFLTNLVALRAQNLDIEVFGSLDPAKAGRAKTSIKPRCIGLWMAHNRSRAEGSAASMACVVPHGSFSLALTAAHGDNQQKNSSNVVPIICHIARSFLCRPVYFYCCLRQLRQKTLLNRSLGVGARAPAPIAAPHPPLTAVLHPPIAAVPHPPLTTVPAPSVTAAVGCRGASFTRATGRCAHLPLLLAEPLTPIAQTAR